jgi:hypothetical protein
LAPADQVDAGVHDDAVQPGRDFGVTAKRRCRPKCRDEGVLDRIGCFVTITECAKSHGPQPIAMAPDDLAERVAVAGAVQRQELLVSDGGAAAVRTGPVDRVPPSVSQDCASDGRTDAVIGRVRPWVQLMRSAVKRDLGNAGAKT